MALAQLAAAMAPSPPPADPLSVARGLSEAAQLGAWLSVAELARLLGVAPGTVRSWSSGHSPRPGFELERRKDGAAVWWRVTAGSD
jgi:transposase-like protein